MAPRTRSRSARSAASEAKGKRAAVKSGARRTPSTRGSAKKTLPKKAAVPLPVEKDNSFEILNAEPELVDSVMEDLPEVPVPEEDAVDFGTDEAEGEILEDQYAGDYAHWNVDSRVLGNFKSGTKVLKNVAEYSRTWVNENFQEGGRGVLKAQCDLFFRRSLEHDDYIQPVHIGTVGRKIVKRFRISKASHNGATDMATRYRGIQLSKTGRHRFQACTHLPAHFVES